MLFVYKKNNVTNQNETSFYYHDYNHSDNVETIFYYNSLTSCKGNERYNPHYHSLDYFRASTTVGLYRFIAMNQFKQYKKGGRQTATALKFVSYLCHTCVIHCMIFRYFSDLFST